MSRPAALASLAILILPPALPAQAIRFTDVTREAGLVEPLAGIMGHGGAWGDIDGDGLIDLFVGGFCDRPNAEYQPAAGPVPTRLFRNLGNGKFELVKQPALEFYGRVSGAVFADLDNNGTLELYSANNARPMTRLKIEPQRSAQARLSNLFRNDKGVFTDISAASGACPTNLHSVRNIGVLDYDNDGLLDLLVVEDRFVKNPRTVLFRNKGNLTFEDVTSAVGLPNDLFGLGLAVADLNEDGRPDFFIGHSNRFFLSGPDGKYREPESLKKLFAWTPLNGEDWPCGAAFGDLNVDGRLDLVIGIHHVRARNKVYLNEGLKDGVPVFRDVTDLVIPLEVPQKCPHVEIQDFDNDGWPDVYFSAAWKDDQDQVTPLIYKNHGPTNQAPLSWSPIGKIQEPMVYFPAGPSGDFDNDGRLDLFLINWFQGNHSRLLRNTSPPLHWLDVQVVGTKMNRMGIGAQVRLYEPNRLGEPGGLIGFGEISTGYGYASGQPAYCHFGLGSVVKVDVAIKLPGGTVITRKGVPADQRLVVTEPWFSRRPRGGAGAN